MTMASLTPIDKVIALLQTLSKPQLYALCLCTLPVFPLNIILTYYIFNSHCYDVIKHDAKGGLEYAKVVYDVNKLRATNVVTNYLKVDKTVKVE